MGRSVIETARAYLVYDYRYWGKGVAGFGFSGRGVPTGTALGRVLADALTGAPRDELGAPLEAPSKVPPLMSLIAPHMVPYYRHLDAKAMRADGRKPPRF